MAATIYADQLGYRLSDRKLAVVPQTCAAFEIILLPEGGANAAVVFRSAPGDTIADAASGDTVRTADFTPVNKPGVYLLRAAGAVSHPFKIDENPYKGLRAAVLKMYEYQKCGVKTDLGIWSHPPCHTGLASVFGTGEKINVTGGWHDAGDYGRYIVPAAQTVADLLLAYEHSDKKDLDLLDTVWFEIEWMLKMQNKADGGVYHKVSCARFNALDEAPHGEKGELVVSPVSRAATADFAAAMALASRFYPENKLALLAAAARAFEWLLNNPGAKGFKNPAGVLTGEYGDANTQDELFWAACEMFAATKNEKYREIIKNGTLSLGLGWANMGTFGIMAYLFHAGAARGDALARKMKNAMITECDKIMRKYETDAFGVSLGTDYVWGSNMTVGNNAMTLLFGAMLSSEKAAAYTEAATEHMRYLLGKNPLSKSYISGFGSRPMRNPHHRPSVAAGAAAPGMVAGGPNMNTHNDPTLYKRRKGCPPGKCYVDNKFSYASNEVAIYWNSPVYFTLAVLGY